MTKKASVKREDSMEDNPVYNQVSPSHSSQSPQQGSSMSYSNSPTIHDTHAVSGAPATNVASNPVYGVSQTSSSSPRPLRSTIRHVQNPVYGDPSDRKTDENVYSTPQELSNGDNVSGQPEYSYATVEASTSGTATLQEGGTLQSTKTVAVVEHEYAMVDKSVKTHNVAAAPLSHTPPPYDQLMHEQGTRDQGKSQSRLAEDEDLGYTAFV